MVHRCRAGQLGLARQCDRNADGVCAAIVEPRMATWKASCEIVGSVALLERLVGPEADDGQARGDSTASSLFFTFSRKT